MKQLVTYVCVCSPFRYAHPVFPHEDDVVHVGPWDVGHQPIADWCTYSIECQYEVSYNREMSSTSTVRAVYVGEYA